MSRGGGATQALSFYENMICGAVSRSIAQVATHPANTMKTLLQSNRGSADPITIKMLPKPEHTGMKMLTCTAGLPSIVHVYGTKLSLHFLLYTCTHGTSTSLE
jgi:hypothetical protein